MPCGDDKMPTKIPSGFRDFPPEMMILRKKVISILENVFQKYGFDPIETPVLEFWDTLKGKYGEEAERMLVYKFKDPWSKEWFALRYDLTVPLARFFSARSLPLPFKRYQIGRVWRHDRPQRGRYREIWQADADIIGSPYPEADAEVISLTIDALSKLGFSNFYLKLNDRRVLSGIFEKNFDLDPRESLRVYRIIDKLDKIGIESVRKELLKIGLKENIVEEIMDVISISGEANELLDILHEKCDPKDKKTTEGLNHLMEILDLLGNKRKYIRIDLSLVRGLDYYTGPIWEATIPETSIGSVAGGGRYDSLIGIYSGHDYPATGTSIGIDRVIDAGLLLGIFNTSIKTYTEICVVVISRDFFSKAWELANTLRDAGFNVQIDLMRRSQQKQREYALKKDIPVLIFIGRKELERKIVTIYDRRNEERKEIPLSDLINYLNRLLRG